MLGPFVRVFEAIFSKHLAPKLHNFIVNKLSNSQKFQNMVRKAENKVEETASNAPEYLEKGKHFGKHFGEELKSVLKEMNPFSRKK
ncbi:hypothetical protein ABK040_015643 [Willaertia magna]